MVRRQLFAFVLPQLDPELISLALCSAYDVTLPTCLVVLRNFYCGRNFGLLKA
jgi:hypothetical protein